MKRFCIVGAGRQGTAAAYDIIKFGNPDSLLLIDSHENGLKNSLEQAASIMGFSPHFPKNGEYASALGALLVAEKNPSD